MKLRSRLGIKLFIMLTIIIVMTMVPFSYTAVMLIERYGKEAASLNETQLLSQARSYLHEITHERARRYQEFFDRVSASAAMLGSHASRIYSDISFYSGNPLADNTLLLSPVNNIFENDIGDPVVTLFWGATGIGQSIQQELNALSHMNPLFQSALSANPEVLASHAITRSGIGLYCTNNLKSKKAAFQLPPSTVFDLRDGEPMTIFTDSNHSQTSVLWTNIYKDDVIEGFMLTASAPIYDSEGSFRGVTGIDVPLDTITNEVINFGSPGNQSSALFSFLLGEEGQVIALPEKYYSLFGLKVDRTAYSHSDERLDLKLTHTSLDAVRDLALQMIANEMHFSSLRWQNETYYVSSSKMSKQHWVVGVVTREAALLSSVMESRSALYDTVASIRSKGLILSLVSILTALLVISLLLRHLINPIRDLAAATQRVAAGDLSVRSLVTTSDEVGLLADSFNTMVNQLEETRNRQKKYADSLELELVIQNSELTKQKAELEKAVSQLKKDEEHHQLVAEALLNIHEQYFDALESTKAGAFIIEDGVLSYVNSAFTSEIFRIARHHLIGRNPLDLIHEKDKNLVAENMRKRLEGEEIPPYSITCVRDDGSTFLGEVWAKISTWHDKKLLVGTITDITHIKESEEKLHVKELELQRSLDEKEVLLKEIYHRTKNNMLVIISLLDLQAQEIGDEKLREMFLVIENRIRSMALVHEKLYQSKSLSEIDMGSYLYELGESILETMVLNDRIKLVSQAESVAINIDYAVPLGLIVNEIIMNSIKHAFPDSRSGTLYLAIKILPKDQILLTVADDGIGLPEDITPQSATSFGIGIIISSLVQMQLKGQISVDRRNGTRYLIRFPKPKSIPRI